MRLAMILGAGVMLLFALIILKKFLSLVKFSFRTILCVAAFAILAAIMWSKRFPVEGF